MSSERSPLLSGKRIDTPRYNDEDSDGYDSDGHITILTSNPPSSRGSIDSTALIPHIQLEDEGEALVKKRLDGAPLITVLFGLWIGVCLSSLDSTIVATIYPQIGTEFKRSNEIIWIATSYMLSYTALQPLYGRISDVFGRKSAIMFAGGVFFIGSFMCGAATNMWMLVISRGIAGIGGGGLNCMTTVISSDLVPLRERGKYQGYGNVAYAVGSVVGAPLGGFITESLGWRYCFYINLPLLVLPLYVSTFLLRNYNLDENSGESMYEKIKKIDYAGAFTIVSAVVLFLLATTLGGNIRPWSDPVVVGCLIGSIIFAIAFCLVEAKFSAFPIMPWSIISSQTPFACSMTNLWCIMSSTALIYMTPIFFQGLLGYKASTAGLFFLPKVVASSSGSVLSGIYMSRTGEYRNLTIIAAFGAFLSVIGHCLWTSSTSAIFIIACLFFEGFCSGIIITTTLISMLSSVGIAEMATITSMSYLFRSIGGVNGISITSAIFQSIVKNILTAKITGPNAEEYIEIARKSMTEVRSLLPPEVLDIVLDSYQIALRYAFISCAAISILTFISTFYIQRFELATKVRSK